MIIYITTYVCNAKFELVISSLLSIAQVTSHHNNTIYKILSTDMKVSIDNGLLVRVLNK